jgi:branched-chain amino acid transport system ATP-binding protein
MSLLEVEGLTRHFGGLRAVEEVSLSVDDGDFLGIVGPNGAGKTTLFSMISGQLEPTAGRLVFDGEDITRWPAHRVARAGLVRTFQLMRPFATMSVLDTVAVAAHTHERSRNAARARALDVLERVRLADQARQGTDRLTTAGLKRLELARALAMRPRVLLLDEVLAGLVPAEREPMIELLRELHADGLTVLYVEHIMAAVMALSRQLLVMHEGRPLAHGDPQQVIRDPRVVEAYLGEEFTA